MQMIYPWQENHWQKMLLALRQKRMPHALLLSGLPGLGKEVFARTLAERLLCEQDNDYQSDYACGKCRACHLVSVGTHPDYFYLAPEEDSASIKVQQLRDLIEKFATQSRGNRYRVAIINPAEAMNRTSANALLKILEEPPGPTLFILVTSHMKALPSTILSRCQKIYFTADDSAAALSWLQPQLVSEANAELLLKLADFAPLQTIELIEEKYLETRSQVLQTLEKIITKEIFPLAAVIHFKDINLSRVLQILLSIILDLVRLHFHVSHQYIINSDYLNILNKLQHKIESQVLLQYMVSVQEIYRVLMKNIPINKEMALERLFIEWSTLPSGGNQ